MSILDYMIYQHVTELPEKIYGFFALRSIFKEIKLQFKTTERLNSFE